MDTSHFNEILYALNPKTREILQKLSPTVKSNVEEVRLRADLPLCLTIQGDTVFVKENGQTEFLYNSNFPILSAADIEECFYLICKGSVYAHEEELKNGFVVMKNGCRAGIFGTLHENGYMQDITSINIRVAREVIGAANEITNNLGGGGLLIAGPPGSGKTTVLRDLIRQVSNGVAGKFQRVAVIDGRGEISGSYGGKRANDLGVNTDVLLTQNKASGIEIAVRTMFPDIVAFDEIGTVEELKSVRECFNSGVKIYTTAHIESQADLMKRNVTAELIKSGAISQVAVLPSIKGGRIKLFSVKEFYREAVV